MAETYNSYYSPSDFTNELESAKSSIESAISMIEDMEEVDFDERAAEIAADAVGEFLQNFKDLIEKFSTFQTDMTKWIDDDSDVYTVTRILNHLNHLMSTSEAKPYVSSYGLSRRLLDAITEVVRVRDQEIEDAAKAAQEAASDTAAY